LKLLLYSHYFAPSIGGVETIVMSLARGLAELRSADGTAEFAVTLVTQTASETFDDVSLPFAIVRRPSLWKLLRLVEAVDIVHIAGPALTPLSLGLLARRPVVIEHHGFQVICPTGQLLIESKQEPCPGHFMAGRHGECWKCSPNLQWFDSRKLWLLTFLRRLLSKQVAANIMPTAWLGKQLGIPYVTIHHGLNSKGSFPKDSAIVPGPPVIVFQGRLVTTKGARILLEAAKILRGQKEEFSILFIGDGPERENLEEIARREPLEGRVEFAGRLSQADVETRLKQARLVVAPSLGGEVFGLVIVENMQRGVPVVASDLGAFVEVLGDTGETFRIGDARDLAKKITKLLHDPRRAEEMGKKGRERVAKQFGIEKMIFEHALCYRRIVRKH
jgi:glycogen synthase